MALINIDLDMKRTTNEAFLKRAVALEPTLIEKTVKPVKLICLDENAQVTAEKPIDLMADLPMKKGDSITLDFGNHLVGYLSLRLKTVGSPQDAPVYLHLKFGEVAKELLEKGEEYDGWISKSWIQEEYIHLDELPTEFELPRRYAFRFLEITTIDTSMKFQVIVEEVKCRSVSAVDMDTVQQLGMGEDCLRQMDKVSLRTLQNCMQSVFEDGPKRDRRLWLGDLRLQALVNYATFQNYDMVKRCLYLFAALTREDGAIGACLFLKPEYLVDDTFFFDYSLFFISALKDYYHETKDLETLQELWPSAYRQLELSRARFSDAHIIKEEGDQWCFIDWKEGLDKQASANAVYVYALNDAIEIATVLKEKHLLKSDYTNTDDAEQDFITALTDEKECRVNAILKAFWDETEQLFVSGKQKQISYASQTWMVLAGVIKGDEARTLLNRVMKLNPEMGMVTPYMNHHFVEALLLTGEKEKAMKHMEYYWGGMLKEGADTFWELYNPTNPTESPYGSNMVNSYCHAWSCTPSYLLRRMF